MTETIDPAYGIPLALLLWAAFIVIELRARRR